MYKTSVRDLSDKKRLLAVQQETEEEKKVEEEEKRFVRLTANEGPFNGGRLRTASTCLMRSACISFGVDHLAGRIKFHIVGRNLLFTKMENIVLERSRFRVCLSRRYV